MLLFLMCSSSFNPFKIYLINTILCSQPWLPQNASLCFLIQKMEYQIQIIPFLFLSLFKDLSSFAMYGLLIKGKSGCFVTFPLVSILEKQSLLSVLLELGKVP